MTAYFTNLHNKKNAACNQARACETTSTNRELVQLIHLIQLTTKYPLMVQNARFSGKYNIIWPQ